MLKVRVVRYDGFVGDRRIIKRKRAGEIPIARNPVSIRRMGRRNHRYNERRAPD